MIAWLPLSIAAGLVSALIVAGSGQWLPVALVISPFAQLPLFLTGLGLGLTPVLVAGLGGAIACAVLGSPYLGVVFLFMHAVPVVLITRHALLSRTTEAGGVGWYPPGRLLLWLTAMTATYFLAVWAFFQLAGDGLGPAIESALRQVMTAMQVPADAEMDAAIEANARYVPGMVATHMMLLVVVNGGLAQRILVRTGRNLRPSPRMDELELPKWLAGVLLAAMLAASFVESFQILGLTLAFILGLAYFLLGLSVVHAFYRGRPNVPFGLVGFYVMLTVMTMIAFPVVLGLVAVGLAEQLIGLRARFGPRVP